jgi:hypothetical protein
LLKLFQATAAAATVEKNLHLAGMTLTFSAAATSPQHKMLFILYFNFNKTHTVGSLTAMMNARVF